MRLALRDVKKTVRRRDGVAFVTPYLLRPRERLREIEALVALHEAWIGRARATFPTERAAELVGDYRLARCLAACLGEWYEWRAPAWPGAASEAEAAALAARELTSPSQLRLALYDFVHAQSGGFFPSAAREAGLSAFCAQIELARATLDDLLALDSEERAVLARVAERPPTARELAARYNARAFEALLANAAEVEWHVTPVDGAEGLGSVVKRVCFLARRMGVHYDVAFDTAIPIRQVPSSPTAGLPLVAEARTLYAVSTGAASDAEEELDGAGRTVVITLFGPQGVTGSPIQYGDRLARLCRALLGYRRAHEAEGSAALATSGLEGVARVHLKGRPLLFPLDERVLKLLRSEAPAEDERMGRAPAGESFDSMLERRMHAEFVALERDGAAHGWRLEREPAPVIARDAIMVPDFALTRGHRRVYLEIVGYWRPDYRERKLRKLAALHGAVALVLAVPSAARAEFAALEASYPVLWFDRRVSAVALLALLDRQYDDLDERLARLDLPAIMREVAQRRRIAPAESMTLLHCYTRNELARALDLLHAAVATADEPAVAWLDGLGLASADWVDRLRTQTRGVLEAAPGGRLALAALCAGLVARLPELTGIAEETAEQVAAQAGLFVTRDSIFYAEVSLEPPTAPASPTTVAPTARDRPQPRGAARRKSAKVRPTATPLSIFPSADDTSDGGA